MKDILEVTDLRVSFQKHHANIDAVRGISFSLKENQKLAIVGESGSGKSVAVKALLQLLPKNTKKVIQGGAYYKGVDLLLLKDREIRKFRGKEIGIIFQDPVNALNPTMKIGKQLYETYHLQYPQHSHHVAQRKILEFLELVGINDPEVCYDQYPFQLSGGMCQRVMIALALIPQPKILIADEPTTALDVTTQSQILALLDELQQQMDMSIIFITHDLSLISGFCHHVLVMYGGKIVESAPVHDLFAQPRHPYTQALLNSLFEMTPADGVHLVSHREKYACPFFLRCPHAMNICKLREPTPTLVDQETQSACWLHEKEEGKNSS